MADDLGYNDITLNGGGVARGAVPTPNIDSIAREGVTFVNGYAGNATCAPSRAAIMTGRYATRFGFEFTPTPPVFSRVVGTFQTPGALHQNRFVGSGIDEDAVRGDREAMPASEITIAKLLRSKGYHTVHLGKWHLGETRGSRPEDQGFDESLGFMAGASKYQLDQDGPSSKQSFDGIDKVIWGMLPFSVQYNGGAPFHPNAFMTDYLTDQAVSVIHQNRNRPFFVYLAYNAPHTPLPDYFTRRGAKTVPSSGGPHNRGIHERLAMGCAPAAPGTVCRNLYSCRTAPTHLGEGPLSRACQGSGNGRSQRRQRVRSGHRQCDYRIVVLEKLNFQGPAPEVGPKLGPQTKKVKFHSFFRGVWRTGWDSNPR